MGGAGFKNKLTSIADSVHTVGPFPDYTKSRSLDSNSGTGSEWEILVAGIFGMNVVEDITVDLAETGTHMLIVEAIEHFGKTGLYSVGNITLGRQIMDWLSFVKLARILR